LIHGWFLTQSVPGRGLAREVYSANRTNEPIALGIAPTPRWRPTLPRGFTLLPSPSPDDVAQGVLRRFGDGTPFFNGGVPAITADGTGRLWGVGSTVDSNGLTFTKSDSLFSINENGYFQRESRQAHYRISPDGTIESFATTGGWANCEGWGKFCCSSGPPATMRGGWTEGVDGRLYGITGDSRYDNSIPAIITLERTGSGETNTFELRSQTRNTRLYRQEGQYSETAWEVTSSGMLVTGTQEGIIAISPGQHGMHPLRVFNPGGADGMSPVGPCFRKDAERSMGSPAAVV
jgi:hypothetical protein